MENLLQSLLTHARLLASGALFFGILHAQAGSAMPPEPQPARSEGTLADSLRRIKEGDPWLFAYHQAGAARAVQVIPDLEKRFSVSDDVIEKCTISSALVRLGLGQGIYWDYLVKEAAEAIDSDAPYPIGLDSTGNVLSEAEAQPFIAWAKVRGLSLAAAAQAIIQLPGRVVLLGESRDPRAIPLLRRGLYSPDFIIQADAAGGLAKVGDKDSIRLIIQACDRAAPEVANAIAQTGLAPFSDPEAQSAVKRYAAAYEDWKAASTQQKHE